MNVREMIEETLLPMKEKETINYRDELALLEHLELLFECPVDGDILEVVLSEDGSDIRKHLCETMQLEEGILKRLVDKLLQLFHKLGEKLRMAWLNIRYRKERKMIAEAAEALNILLKKLEGKGTMPGESFYLGVVESAGSQTIDTLVESLEEAFNPLKMLGRFLKRVVKSLQKRVEKLKKRPKPLIVSKLARLIRQILSAIKVWLPEAVGGAAVGAVAGAGLAAVGGVGAAGLAGGALVGAIALALPSITDMVFSTVKLRKMEKVNLLLVKAKVEELLDMLSKRLSRETGQHVEPLELVHLLRSRKGKKFFEEMLKQCHMLLAKSFLVNQHDISGDVPSHFSGPPIIWYKEQVTLLADEKQWEALRERARDMLEISLEKLTKELKR